MMTNVGNIDRLIRAKFGLVLLLLGWFLADINLGLPGGTAGFYVVGAVLLGTAAFRFCPAYRLVGLSTCAKSQEG